jgi:hypothetical protein
MPKLQYPYSWFPGRPRTLVKQPTTTRISLARAADDLLYELEQLAATEVVISCDVQPLPDFAGYPETYKSPIDPGVAVSFHLGETTYGFTCDAWDTVAGNMRDIGLAIAHKRLCQYRCTPIDREFFGYKAKVILPTRDSTRRKPWWQVLYVAPDAPAVVIEAAYKSLCKHYHPDRGGTHEAMTELNRAFEEARAHAQ